MCDNTYTKILLSVMMTAAAIASVLAVVYLIKNLWEGY